MSDLDIYIVSHHSVIFLLLSHYLSSFIPKWIRQQHILFFFLFIVIPSSASRKALFKYIFECLTHSKKRSFCYGLTARSQYEPVVITWRNGGELLQKTLQWLVCLLHANELPLRHHVSAFRWNNYRTYKGFSHLIGKSLYIWNSI